MSILDLDPFVARLGAPRGFQRNLHRVRRNEEQAFPIAQHHVARHYRGVADAMGMLIPVTMTLFNESGAVPR